WRIQRQLLTEAVALSVLGGVGGVVLAYRLLPLLVKWLPEFSFPHEVVIGVNVPVLCFTLTVAMLTGILFGMAPAYQSSGPELAQLMQTSSRRVIGRGRRAHRMLVAGQIALTLLLLTSAGAAM